MSMESFPIISREELEVIRKANPELFKEKLPSRFEKFVKRVKGIARTAQAKETGFYEQIARRIAKPTRFYE